MSRQDNIQESLQPLVDTSQTSEITTPSLRNSNSLDVDDATTVNVLKHDIHSPNGQRKADNTASTSEAVDPNSRVVFVEQPNPRSNMIHFIGQDLPESTCGLSDSLSLTTEDSDEIDIPLELDPPCGILGKCYRKYENQMRMFRTNGYLLPFEIFCLPFTITCCFMGAYNWPLCPADAYVPRYVFFNGACATLSICIQITNSLWKLILQYHEGNSRVICAFCFGWVAIIMTLVEMMEFYAMSYSFHRHLENYCSKAFYKFVHYKNIAFGVIMVLVAMFYIPGRNSNHYLAELGLGFQNWYMLIIVAASSDLHTFIFIKKIASQFSLECHPYI